MQIFVRGGILLAVVTVMVLAALPAPESEAASASASRGSEVIEIPARGIVLVPALGFPGILVPVPWTATLVDEPIAIAGAFHAVRLPDGALRPAVIPSSLALLIRCQARN